MRKIKNSKKGQSIVISLMFILVMTMLVSIVGITLTRDKKVLKMEETRNDTFYTAESAEQLAKYHLEMFAKNKFEALKSSWGGNIAARLIQNPDTFFDDINTDTNFKDLVSGKVSPKISHVDKNNNIIEVNNPDGSSYAYFFFDDKNNNGIKDAGEEGFVVNQIQMEEKKQAYKFQYNLTIYGYKGTFANKTNARKIYKTGVLTLEAGPDSFAKFALFTNSHVTETGTDIWFTERTNFDGPVHTNGANNSEFRFSGTGANGKSATFTGEVTSANTNIMWYNGGSSINQTNLDLSVSNPKNGNIDQPVFKKGYQRGAPVINLPVNAFSQQRASLGGDSSNTANLTDSDLKGYLGLSGSGAVPNDIYIAQNNGEISGGIYVKGSVDTMILSVDNGKQVYTIEQGTGSSAIKKTITVDTVNNQTMIVDTRPVTTCEQVLNPCKTEIPGTCKIWNTNWKGQNTTCKEYYPSTCQAGYDNVCTTSPQTTNQTLDGVPKGSLYVDGSINFLGGPPRNPSNSTDSSKAPPAIEANTELTITAKNDIVIQRDIKYEINPLGPDGIGGTADDNPDAINVLGLFSSTGNVVVGTSAPNNAALHASVMASNGVFKVENYDANVDRGSFELVGGVISQKYGAFGTFSMSNGKTTNKGYGRDYRYDRRFLAGKSPPYFPTVSGLIMREPTFSSEIWQEKSL